jgi:hypothetical protein
MWIYRGYQFKAIIEDFIWKSRNTTKPEDLSRLSFDVDESGTAT